jgi:hypothetical protein
MPRSRPDAREPKIAEALRILAAVAAEDADHAKNRNGKGFSRADSKKGHVLAKTTLAAALSDDQHAADILALAARYRRQTSRASQTDLF